ncbi:MAG: transcriptional repressor [Acidimicrobiales bacterium]|nr:transcriptional repressor [Acidimicrobiales bacterium]
MKTPEELTGLFRERGLKVTPQRQRIFRALHETREHPTAEAVYDEVRREMPTISLRTVYQTLNDLTAMGELHQLCLDSGSARFDPTAAPHHHLVCDGCGAVADVHAEFTDVRVPDDSGFTVSSTEIVFRGRCRECQGEAITAADPQIPTAAQPKEHAAHG